MGEVAHLYRLLVEPPAGHDRQAELLVLLQRRQLQRLRVVLLCPQRHCWHSWKNATQMPAISWQLTSCSFASWSSFIFRCTETFA